MSIQSCIYAGEVCHRRFEPVPHDFRYRLFLMYIDLDELPTLFQQHWLWSSDRPNVAWFRRADHVGGVDRPLAESIRDLVASRTGHRPIGPIRMLTNFRYFGFATNPITLFYCFDADQKLEAVVAEVTNTPWREQHCYVLDLRSEPGPTYGSKAAKELHVSPFLGMDFDYEFRLTQPGESLAVHINNLKKHANNSTPMFDAKLSLRRRPLNSTELARSLFRYPLLTVQVFAKIYWQAFRLWRKGVPFVPHPAANSDRRGPSIEPDLTVAPTTKLNQMESKELQKVP